MSSIDSDDAFDRFSGKHRRLNWFSRAALTSYATVMGPVLVVVILGMLSQLTLALVNKVEDHLKQQDVEMAKAIENQKQIISTSEQLSQLAIILDNQSKMFQRLLSQHKQIQDTQAKFADHLEKTHQNIPPKQ